MNANEVISNRAIELTGGDRFAKQEADPPQRPRQHGAIDQRHVPDRDPRRRRPGHRQGADPRPAALPRACSPTRPRQWDDIIKIGRTHLADATPIRLGQEFSGYARQLELSRRAGRSAPCTRSLELPAGGTAVGTGINTHPQFGAKVAEVLAKETGVPFVEAKNHFPRGARPPDILIATRRSPQLS